MFTELESFHDLRWLLAIAWHFEDVAGEVWTHRLNEFARGRPEAVRGAINVVSLALRGIDWRGRRIGLTAGLSSGGRLARPGSPLALLGEGVAARTGMAWFPNILQRRFGFVPQVLRSLRDPRAGIAQRLECRRVEGLTTVLVLDDIVRSGDRLSEAARAVRARNGDIEVFGLALGKSTSWGRARLGGQNLSNRHVPPAWRRIWDRAAAPPVAAVRGPAETGGT